MKDRDQSRFLLSNEELLQRYQNADVGAFEEFFRRHQTLVFNFLFSKLGNRFEAEEAFQKTFLRVHRSILSYDPSQSALPWLFAVARNVALDLKMRRSEAWENLDAIKTYVETEPMLEARNVVEKILSELDDVDRKLLELRFLYEETCEDIATQEGWSSAKARQKLSRLLRKLKIREGEL